MLGLPLRQVLQTAASTSRRPAQLHTSAIQLASRKQSSVIRKQNILTQTKRAKEAQADRPSVVLGTRTSEEETKWRNCKLAKILVDEAALARGEHIAAVEIPVGAVQLPKVMAFGIGEDEKELLFDHLPSMSAAATVAPRAKDAGEPLGFAAERAADKELRKAAVFSKVVDLRNTNAAGIAFENRRRIVLAFSTPQNPYDTGRAEVQAAIKTYEIRNLWRHLTTYKRDVGNRLGLRKLVHERAKILRYLRNTNRDRYETLLEQLALEPEAVEGELVV